MKKAIATWTTTQSEEDAMNDDHAPLWRHMIALTEEDTFKDKSVLDFGCNQGGFLELLYKVKPYKNALGVDIATESFAFAAQRLAKLPANTAHTDKLSEYKGAFDVAFSHEVLYLLPDLAAHAAQIKQALKPGGVYYAAIGCHTDQAQWPTWKKLIGDYSNVPVQDYSLDDYAAAFMDAGFSAAVQPYRLDGFYPLSAGSAYFPKVTDTIRYYNEDKVLFRFKAGA